MDNKIERITPLLLLSLLVVQIVFLSLLFLRVRVVEDHLVVLNNFFMPASTLENTTAVENTIADIPIDESPFRGMPDTPVTIIEFSDFNCTYCRQVQSTLDDLIDKYDGQVQIHYKYFPLSTDPNSSNFLAATAAECSYQQDAFWEMHDLLFENPTDWDREELAGLAKELNLDELEFNSCLDSEDTALRIQSDIKLGQENGVNATPTFFINGRLVAGASPIEVFEEVIEKISQ